MRRICLLIALVALCGVAFADCLDESYHRICRRAVVYRGRGDGLVRLRAKLRRGEPVTIAASGGSLTVGRRAVPPDVNGWFWLVIAGLCETFPQASITAVNAALCGMTSPEGAEQFESSILCHQPDLIFFEHAVNDANHLAAGTITEGEVVAALRGMVGATYQQHPRPAVILVETMRVDGGSAERLHWTAVRGYHPTMISMRAALWPEHLRAELDVGSLYHNDGVHPNNAGHAWIAAMVMEYVGGKGAKPPSH